MLRQLSAPYDPSSKANPIGQGWWVQVEFGSGKSHLLSFIGALALGDKKVLGHRQRHGDEEQEGQAGIDLPVLRRLGLAKKSTGKSKGIFVSCEDSRPARVKNWHHRCHRYRSQAHGIHSRRRCRTSITPRTGKPISIYPVEVLADRFESKKWSRYRKPTWQSSSKTPKFFDEEEQGRTGGVPRRLATAASQPRRYDEGCGQKLWRFYKEYLKTTPEASRGKPKKS